MKAKGDLTHARLLELFDLEQAKLGRLVWNKRAGVRQQWNTRYAGRPAGRILSHGYLVVSVSRVSYSNHRLIYCMVRGVDLSEILDFQIDHINHNPLDNRPENLRPCTQSENNRNRNGASRGAVSVYLGVSYYKRTGKWRASCRNLDGSHKHLGYFNTEAEANAAAINHRAASPCAFRLDAAPVRHPI